MNAKINRGYNNIGQTSPNVGKSRDLQMHREVGHFLKRRLKKHRHVFFDDLLIFKKNKDNKKLHVDETED